jgi:two-component system nitrogen regulation sensor histidine kinase NtrY
MDGPDPVGERTPLRHEQKILLLTLLAGLPATLFALWYLWSGDFTLKVQWTLTVLFLLCWGGLAVAVRTEVMRPLQTLSNLLGALREGDFSIRARKHDPASPLGLAVHEANILSETLREQRLEALEAGALLRKVMEEIEVAVFTFDGEGVLRLTNRAGERLLRRRAAGMLGRHAGQLGLGEVLEGPPHQTLEAGFPGGGGRWEVRRSSFRQEGRLHRLVVVTDLSRALREEERLAWQRLIRVLGHEINNSLAPIRSLAESLQGLVERQPRDPEWETDLNQGLEVVRSRAEALGRFMSAYARLTRLPPPRPSPVRVEEWVRGVVGLEPRQAVRVEDGPAVEISADGDQLGQLLINLVRNAADAALETGGGVTVGWRLDGEDLEVEVLDEGPGLSEEADLFVPFYTTKPEGSGIGLALARQIAESHGGSLRLENRSDRPGCRATVRLPLTGPTSGDKRPLPSPGDPDIV